MIFDTHSHCYFENLKGKIPEILDKMQEKNVRYAVQIGCDVETSREAISLAKNFSKNFFATVGLHPETSQNENSWREQIDEILVQFGLNSIKNFENFENFLEKIDSKNDDFWNEIFKKIEILAEFENLILQHKKSIVAIGETGLDFHYIDGTNGGKNSAHLDALSEKAKTQIENQKFYWLAQWKLAQKYDFPLVIHTRDARRATLDFIKKSQMTHLVMHCYSENPEMARELMNFSSEIYFSFSGIVTYKNAISVQETAKIIPLNRILIETDSPFLSPQAVR